MRHVGAWARVAGGHVSSEGEERGDMRRATLTHGHTGPSPQVMRLGLVAAEGQAPSNFLGGLQRCERKKMQVAKAAGVGF